MNDNNITIDKDKLFRLCQDIFEAAATHSLSYYDSVMFDKDLLKIQIEILED